VADLTTLANVKAWLGQPAPLPDDAALALLITGVSGMVEEYLNRTILSAPYTETRSGRGTSLMVLRNHPIIAVTSVTVSDVVLTQATNTTMTGWRFFSDSIMLNGGDIFPIGLANIVIVYTAGYATVPFAIERAVIETVALRWKERDRIGHQSKSMGGETVSFFTGGLPASAKLTLDQYQDVVPIL